MIAVVLLQFPCYFSLIFTKFSQNISNVGCILSLSAFGESCPRWDWASVTLYTFAESSQFWRAIRGDSQAKHETLWLVHHGPLKKRDLNEVRHEHRSYTRGSKTRRVFPSTFSLSPSLGFPRRECTAGIKVIFRKMAMKLRSDFGETFEQLWSIFRKILEKCWQKHFRQIFSEILKEYSVNLEKFRRSFKDF